MEITGFDHIVLAVADVDATCRFYERHLGLRRVEEKPGKWSLHFGTQKISLQAADAVPEIAKATRPGSGNICLLLDGDVRELAERLAGAGVEILVGPAERIGAMGRILSIYFRDPDGNLVEVGQPI